MRYRLVSVNIKQKYHLNMNPACSVHLCVNEWRRCAVSFATHIQKCETRRSRDPSTSMHA